jgi:hypothetical protein
MSEGKKPATKRTKLEMEAVYADVEDHLVRLRQEGRVKHALVQKYQVNPHTVGRWIKEVFARYRATVTPEDRENRRHLMRATLDTIASMALNKTVTVRDANGKPVIDQATGKPFKVAAPDLKNALDACKQLRDLDGLDEPIKVETTQNGKTTTTVLFGEDDRKALRDALRGMG